MNLYSCIRALQKIGGSHPSVNSVGDGSIYDFANANPSLKYACYFISQTTHRQDDYFDYYGLNIFYFDRLIDDLESNRLQIQSIGKDVINNSLKLFCESFNGSSYSQLSFIPFTQRFSDLCAGVYATVQLKIPIMVICSEDFEELTVFTGDCQECYNEGYAQGLSQTYEDGFESGRTYQKSLMLATQFTENGTYTREDGWNVVTVNIDVDKYFNDGYLSGVTDQKNKLISVFITENGQYNRADGYNSITVAVECVSGDCSEAYESGWTNGYTSGFTDGYDSGYTDGYQDGLEDCGKDYEEGYDDGIEHQKSLLTGILIEHNGNYTREDGYSAITVNVPQSGHTDEELDEAYNSGITYQKSLLSSTAFTVNGLYSKEDGWSAITVNVPQTGYTQEDLDNAYSSGYTSGSTDGYGSGITYQKSLLISTAFTENGLYTREDGWSAVTVNIDTQSYWDSGYTSGYTDAINKPTLLVTPTDINAPVLASTTQISVASNTDWVINSYPSWITLSSLSGNGWVTIDATIDSNIGSTERTGSIIFKTTDNSVTRTVSITQQAQDYANNYTTFNVIEDGYINWHFEKCDGCEEPYSSPLTIQYRKNGGSWSSITASTGGTIINVVSGDIVEFKAENQTYYTSEYGEYSNFEGTTAKFRLTGNINSMFYGDNFSDKARLAGKSARFLFGNCTGLVDASGFVLPSTQLDASNYYALFEGCTNLVYSPSELPALILYGSCYKEMFKGCTSLVTVPKLPATVLKKACYSYMFQDCTSLTTAPKLSATTLADTCYMYMFAGCTSLVNAPALPATALVVGCYAGMFWGCTSLTTAPVLSATTLVDTCYSRMFNNCSNLNYIKCLATDISATNCTYMWVNGVSATGTFIRKYGMASWTRGTNGVPVDWTVISES